MDPLPPVRLNEFDCDRGVTIEMNGLQASSNCGNGVVAYMCGARANLGLTGEKYCFSCEVLSAIRPDQPHYCIVGITRGYCGMGELEESLNFSATGLFKGLGTNCDVGKTILCAVDLEKAPKLKIDFFENGKNLFVRPKHLHVKEVENWQAALFPHIRLQNVKVQLKFSSDDGLVPQTGYNPWAEAMLVDHSASGPTS